VPARISRRSRSSLGTGAKARRHHAIARALLARGQDATAQPLLGASGEFGSRIGLDNRWTFNAIRAVGNYGEVFERNVGEESPLKSHRGLNSLWTAGGLMYAVPFR
jgi:general L-amino acid transport system substrate-binding protein